MSQTRRVQRKKIERSFAVVDRSRRKQRAMLIRFRIKDYGMLKETRT